MIELIEKTVLAGVGALSLSQKKAEELLEELKKQLNLSEEEGREFFEKLQKSAEEGRNKVEELAREEVRKSCERLGVVTKDDYDKLSRKVARLEKSVKALQG